MDLLPKVFRTEGNITDFDSSKIYESILKDTKISLKDAKLITELTVRRIINYGIKFLSGPHIREIVCSILSEQHFENERKLYTRIGMPLMDYEELLEKGVKKMMINPEKIHHMAANKIAEEFAHLRLLSNEESKAHLAGDIYINGLNYFDSRPFSQTWDLRFLLKNGLPLINKISSFCKVNPASNFREAVNDMLKWLTMTQSEFYGTQGFDFITIYLAPYIRGLSDEKIKQALRTLICEINRLSVIIGREIPPLFSSLTPSILKELNELPAITPGGIVKGTYSDYNKECLRLFKILTLVYKEENKLIQSLKTLEIKAICDFSFISENNEAFSSVWDEIQATHNSYLINFENKNYRKKVLEYITNSGSSNTGVLQNICLNLPRSAYMSQNEDEFFEVLNDEINLCLEIFSKKYGIIKKRMKSNHLPICSSFNDGVPIFDLGNQKYAISFIGLNEAVKFLTNYHLHENLDSFSFGVKIVRNMEEMCSKLSDEKMSYVVSENFSYQALQRFSKLDLKHFKHFIEKLNVEKNREIYSNSFHFKSGIEIDLYDKIKKQGEFHQIVQMGACEQISLLELKKNNISLHDFINVVIKDSNLTQLKFKS